MTNTTRRNLLRFGTTAAAYLRRSDWQIGDPCCDRHPMSASVVDPAGDAFDLDQGAGDGDHQWDNDDRDDGDGDDPGDQHVASRPAAKHSKSQRFDRDPHNTGPQDGRNER